MNEQVLIRRLTQAAGSLRPSVEATAEDLAQARKRLASCLLRGQTEDILPAVGHRFADPDRPTPEDLDQATIAEITAIAHQAQTAERQRRGRPPSERIFRRQVPFRTFRGIGSVPAWAVGVAADETLGPFRGANDRPFWFDVFATAPQVLVVRGARGPVLLTVPQPQPVPGSRVEFILPQGSVWIASQLLTPAVPNGAFTGFRIHEGRLAFSTPPTLTGDRLVAPPRSTLTLQLTLDPPLPPPVTPGPGPGADGRDSSVSLPKQVTLRFSPSGIGRVIAADNAVLKAFGSIVSLRFANRGPVTFEPALSRILISFHAEPALFDVVSVQSDLFLLQGNAAIERAAWALPITIPVGGDPNTLGQAAGAGAMVLVTAGGLTASWPGLESDSGGGATVTLGPTFLFVEPGRIILTVPQASGRRKTQTFSLWKESGNGPARRSSIRLAYSQGFSAEFDSDAVAGADFLDVAGLEATAHIDRPVAADGKRIPFHSSACELALIEFAGSVFIDLGAPTDFPPGTPAQLALALTNALLPTLPPDHLALLGSVRQGNDVTAGDLFLELGLLAVVPTLPDPYAASFSAFPQGFAVGPGTRLVGEVKWSDPEAADLTFSLLFPPVAPANAAAAVDSVRGTLDQPPSFARSGSEPAVPTDPLLTELEALFYRLAGGGPESFGLLDVSGGADQFGIAFGTPYPGPRIVPLKIRGLDMVTPGNNLRVFTLPPFQWEPVWNIPNPENPEVFPAELVSDSDGGPAKIGFGTVALVPLAPAPALTDFVGAYNNAEGAASGAVWLPLPFGLVAVAELSRERQRFLAPGLQSIRLDFPTAVDGDGLQANQISLTGGIPNFPPGPRDESAGFAGATAQLRNGRDGAGILPDGFSVLGDAVTDIFNGEFAPGQARPRVPLTRIDWSGYGATCFSDWRNPAANPPAVSQVRLDGLVGRTAYEVVQVFSFLYPWGVRVVRTITLQRSGSGGVFRRDSGWQAISDGLYDFRSGAGDPGIITHTGIVRGLYDVRHIRDTTQLYQRDYPNPDRPETVKLTAVRFDADVDIEGVRVGANSAGRVPASDMLGYIQREPSGIPLTPAQLNDLLVDRGPIGGSIDCVVDIGDSGQRMRVSAVEVDGAINIDGNPEFVATARGSLMLPRAGRWTVTYQAQLEPEPHALASDTSFPLIRQNPANGALSPYRFADPVDLFRPDNPSSNYALLQLTDAQRLLFPRPKIEAGDTAITSTLPFLLADAYILAGGATIFPRPERCIPLPDGSRLQVTGSGRIRLFIPPQAGLPANTFIAAAPERILIDSGSLKARLIYSDENDQPTQVRIVIDSDAHPDWSISIGPVSVITDLDAFSGLMRVVGTFTGQTDTAPNLDPHLVFGGVLQPVQEIINILQKIDLPFPLFVLARANQLKVGGSLEIPPQVGAPPEGIDIGVGKLEGELKVLLNLSGEPGQGILAPTNQTLVDFELKGNVQTDLLPPLPVTGGPMFRFTIEGRGGQSPKIRLFGGGVVSVDLDVPLDIAEAKAEVAYTYVLQIRGGTIGLGVDVEAKLKIDVLNGLASVEATAEFLALATRLLIDAPGGAVPGPTVQIQGELTFAVEVTLGWVFDIDIEVQTQFRTRLNLPLFIAAALLL